MPFDDEAAPDWLDEPYPLGYIRMAGLAQHLTQLVADGRMDLVAPVLDRAEAALVGGDDDTQALVTVGLLEDFQSDCRQSEGRIDLADVRVHLGPKSKAAWDELMRFWYGPREEGR